MACSSRPSIVSDPAVFFNAGSHLACKTGVSGERSALNPCPVTRCLTVSESSGASPVNPDITAGTRLNVDAIQKRPEIFER